MSEAPSLPKIVREVALVHPDLADPKDLAPFVLEAVKGHEEEILRRLISPVIANVLRRRERGGTSAEEWDGFLKERLPTPTGVVFISNAHADDLEQAASRREAFAGNLDRRAQQFRHVAARLRLDKVPTPGELSREVGVELIRDLEGEHIALYLKRRGLQARRRDLERVSRYRDRLREDLTRGEAVEVRLLREALVALRETKQSLVDGIAKGRAVDAAFKGLRATG